MALDLPTPLTRTVKGVPVWAWATLAVIGITVAIYMRKRARESEDIEASPEDLEDAGYDPYQVGSGYGGGFGGIGNGTGAIPEITADDVYAIRDDIEGWFNDLTDTVNDGFDNVTGEHAEHEEDTSIPHPDVTNPPDPNAPLPNAPNPCTLIRCPRGYHKVKKGTKCKCVKDKVAGPALTGGSVNGNVKGSGKGGGHGCPKGYKWDNAKKRCVKKAKANV